MRSAGNCTVHHSLTAEAASVVKQSVALARRRGHAQVTPLHVANTMLSASTGLLRAACLQSHSHPLQCKALDLCFNVALNRLPATSSAAGPMLGAYSQQYPSISNALVAAFKRAQAHQRRGSVDTQQQPLLAVKIELEQLIVSILDDPSVSRVMREAGFSSTHVKSNVEQAVSLELCSQTQNSSSSGAAKSKKISSLLHMRRPAASVKVRDEDLTAVTESLMESKRRSLVLVGESAADMEGVVGGLMDRVGKGDHDVCGVLREVKFVSIPLSSLEKHSKEEVEQKLEELRGIIRSFVEKGIVLYLGDLKWITDRYRASSVGYGSSFCYCPVEHTVVEIGRLVHKSGENGRLWIMGVATFQTYIRCREGHPPLETVWRLHPVTIPACSLGLSLLPNSCDMENHECRSKETENGSCSLVMLGGEEEKTSLNCCADCSSNFETDQAQRLTQNSTCKSEMTTSSLPTWLQDDGTNKKLINNNDQINYVSVRELCEKWNSVCSSSSHKQCHDQRTLTLSSLSPSNSSISCFSYNQQRHRINTAVLDQPVEPILRLYIPDEKAGDDHHPQQELFFSSNTPNSTSSSDLFQNNTDHHASRFKEFNAENLKTLCRMLEEKVPWQKDVIPDIAGTILQCRSGVSKRKDKTRQSVGGGDDAKEETWLFFQGVDSQAKEKIARELAKAVFGSYSSFLSIALSSFSSPRADSTESNKRTRDERSGGYVERFAEAVGVNPHRVFFMEGVEQADYWSQVGIKRAIERGWMKNKVGEEVRLEDAIVVLSCESFSSRSRAGSPTDGPVKEKGVGMDETASPGLFLDLNMSLGDDEDDDDDGNNSVQSIDDIGLVESVDRRIVFAVQDL